MQAACHAIRVVRSKGDMQPGGLGQCRPDKIDDCTAAGQDNAVIVDITAQFGRYLAQQVHNHPGDAGNMLFHHGKQITYRRFQGCGQSVHEVAPLEPDRGARGCLFLEHPDDVAFRVFSSVHADEKLVLKMEMIGNRAIKRIASAA